jgi:hypothetical protein
MEEQFEIGDLVVYTLTDGISYFGTITYTGSGFYTVDTYTGNIPKSKVHHADLPFKKGDTVRVKKDLLPGRRYGKITFLESMRSIRGTVTTITKVSKNGTYYLKNSDGYTLSKEMLEFPVKVNDIVLLTNYAKYPKLSGTFYSVSKVGANYVELRNGVTGITVPITDIEIVEPIDLDTIPNVKLATVSEIRNTINTLNSLENENQLQRKGTSLIRGEHPEGSRIYGRRPKAAVSIRPLSNKARAGYSQG